MPLSRIQTDALQSAITSGNILDGTIQTVDVSSSAYGVVNNSLRNKLINGTMSIDQRNAGASVSISTNPTTYLVDRFLIEHGAITSSGDAVQRVADAPTGFTHSFKYTSGTTSFSGTTGWKGINQRIEGQNLVDLKYGTASAETCILSFWVKSSVTGTYAIMLSHYNGVQERFFTQNYTINAANTWEYKTVTIAGDTTHTITADNGATGWMRVYWVLGGDSSKAWATASSTGTWYNASGTQRASSAVTNGLVNTNGATFQITGTQLEKGVTATPFEYRPFGTELALCQRYYYNTYQNGISSGVESAPVVGSVYYYQSGAVAGSWTHPVRMRTTPSITFYESHINIAPGNTTFSSPQVTADFLSYLTAANTTVNAYPARTHLAASSEL